MGGWGKIINIPKVRRWGPFSMEKRANFPALFVWLFSRKMGPFFHEKEGPFSCSLCMVTFQEDGALFSWKREPIFLLSLYGYFPGKLGSFSMVKRAHFSGLFVWLFSSKMGPFFHGKYLILYQSVYQNEELYYKRYIDNIIILQSGQAL